MNEETMCSSCGENINRIAMKCHFCDDGYALCKDCAEEHRGWCNTKDEWEFPPFDE